MFVGTTGDNVKTEFDKLRSESLSVFNDLFSIGFKGGKSGFMKRDANAGNRMIKGSSLKTWEDGKIKGFFCISENWI